MRTFTFQVSLRRSGLSCLYKDCESNHIPNHDGECQADHEQHRQRTVQETTAAESTQRGQRSARPESRWWRGSQVQWRVCGCQENRCIRRSAGVGKQSGHGRGWTGLSLRWVVRPLKKPCPQRKDGSVEKEEGRWITYKKKKICSWNRHRFHCLHPGNMRKIPTVVERLQTIIEKTKHSDWFLETFLFVCAHQTFALQHSSDTGSVAHPSTLMLVNSVWGRLTTRNVATHCSHIRQGPRCSQLGTEHFSELTTEYKGPSSLMLYTECECRRVQTYGR